METPSLDLVRGHPGPVDSEDAHVGLAAWLCHRFRYQAIHRGRAAGGGRRALSGALPHGGQGLD